MLTECISRSEHALGSRRITSGAASAPLAASCGSLGCWLLGMFGRDSQFRRWSKREAVVHDGTGVRSDLAEGSAGKEAPCPSLVASPASLPKFWHLGGLRGRRSGQVGWKQTFTPSFPVFPPTINTQEHLQSCSGCLWDCTLGFKAERLAG